MSWTETARRQYGRRGRRYSSDLTDPEWAIIAPLLPPARPTGRPRTTDLRAVMDAVLYMASRSLSPNRRGLKVAALPSAMTA